jgi:predicted membrane metal-binding protein
MNHITRQLNIVLVVAILDAILLVPLLYGFITDSEVHKEILGPIHGIGFLILVFLTARGAAEKLWGWWFPAIVVVTGGPPGSIVGDLVVRARLRG